METLLVLWAFPRAMFLELALPAQLLMALWTLQFVLVGKKAPINNLLTVTNRTKEEILLVVKHTRIVAEPLVLGPDVLVADKPDLALSRSSLAAMLQAPQILVPHLLLDKGVECSLVAPEAENVITSLKLKQSRLTTIQIVIDITFLILSHRPPNQSF